VTFSEGIGFGNLWVCGTWFGLEAVLVMCLVFDGMGEG